MSNQLLLSAANRLIGRSQQSRKHGDFKRARIQCLAASRVLRKAFQIASHK